MKYHQDLPIFIEHEGELVRHLRVVFPMKLSQSIVGRYKHIVKHQGLRALFAYMEVLKRKLVYLHRQPREELIEQRRTGSNLGSWKGISQCFRDVSLRFDGLTKALNALTLKGVFTHPEPSFTDYRREVSSFVEINKDYPFIKYDIQGHEVIPEGQERLIRAISKLALQMQSLKSSVDSPFSWKMEYPWDSEKRMKYDRGKSLKCNEVTPRDIVQAGVNLFPSLMLEFYHYFEFLFGTLMPPENLLEHQARTNKESGLADVAGNFVLLTKDRGYKLRGIFNATIALQLALSALHNWLKDAHKREFTSHCMDQDAGKAQVTRMFDEGRTLTSVDLKSASNYIPLSAQIRFLYNMLPNQPFKDEMIQVYKRSCLMTWETPFESIFIWNGAGSPMGLRGNYYCWSLMLINWFYLLGLSKWDFVVVGDDLVIDARYTELVLELFQRVGIKVSANKSYFDQVDIAEFCGVLWSKGLPLKRYKKADIYSKQNPMKQIRKTGLLGTMRGFGLLEEQVQEYLSSLLLKEKSCSKNVYDPTFDPPPMEKGGYTLEQYARMGVVTNDEYVIVAALTVLRHSNPKYLADDFINDEIVIPDQVDRKGKVLVPSKTYVPSKVFAFERKEGCLWINGEPILSRIKTVKRLLEVVTDILHQRLKQYSNLEFPGFRPAYADDMSSVWVSIAQEVGRLKTSNRPEIAAEVDEFIKQNCEQYGETLDKYKPTVRSILSDSSVLTDGICNYVGPELKAILEEPPIKGDLREGKRYQGNLFLVSLMSWSYSRLDRKGKALWSIIDLAIRKVWAKWIVK